MQRETASRQQLPAVATGVGGLVVLIAALLPWHALKVAPSFLQNLPSGILNLPTSFTQKVAGTQGLDGKVAVVGGLVLIVAAVVMWMSPTQRTYKIMAIIALVVGVVVTFLIVADLVGGDSVFKAFFRSSIRDFAQKHLGGLINPTDQQIDSFRTALGITLEKQAGIFIALIGSIVALVGSVLALTTSKRTVAASAASTAPTTPAF